MSIHTVDFEPREHVSDYGFTEVFDRDQGRSAVNLMAAQLSERITATDTRTLVLPMDSGIIAFACVLESPDYFQVDPTELKLVYAKKFSDQPSILTTAGIHDLAAD